MLDFSFTFNQQKVKNGLAPYGCLLSLQRKDTFIFTALLFLLRFHGLFHFFGEEAVFGFSLSFGFRGTGTGGTGAFVVGFALVLSGGTFTRFISTGGSIAGTMGRAGTGGGAYSHQEEETPYD